MKIETIPILDISFHSAIKQLPPPPDDLIQSLIVDLEDRPEMAPLVVDEKNRVIDVDSADRLAAALKCDFLEVPVVRRAEGEPVTAIVKSLSLRRNYSKAAVVYACLPLRLGPEILQRRPKGNSAQNALFSKKLREFALLVGCSERLVDQGVQLHRALAECPDAKTSVEPLVLDGKLCLGYAINAVAGFKATLDGKNRGQAGLTQLELFGKTTELFSKRMKGLAAASKTVRFEAARELASTVGDWFPEARREVYRALHLLESEGVPR